MTEAERKSLKEKIHEEIVKIEAAIVPLLDATKPISPENSLGRISRMDAINNKGVAEAALRSAKTKLSKLQIALTKIDNTDFGKCSMCKNPIRPARLMYLPESTKCVRCADRR